MTDQQRPYADAAPDYFAAGWAPIPVRGKWPPPKGWTGTEAPYPTYPDVQAWIDGDEGKLNIGLRLPRHVIGIDVDNYGDKHGGRTLAEHEQRLGPLPATWTTSSRGDGVSGIRLFTVPEGLRWPGELRGGGVEIIQHKHRYAMVWPSVHPDTGERYEWTDPTGVLASAHPAVEHGDETPHVDQLPNLPEAWIAELTGGRSAEDVVKADLGDQQAAAWLIQHGHGERCPAMLRAIGRCAGEMLAQGASRHDAAMRGVARIAHLTAEGHRGGLLAMTDLSEAFGAAVRGDSTRAGEWSRLVVGAVQIAAAGPLVEHDPCLTPFVRPDQPVTEIGALTPWTPPTSLNTPSAANLSPSLSPTLTSSSAAPGVATTDSNITTESALTNASIALVSSTTTEIDPALKLAIDTEAAQVRIRRAARDLVAAEEALREFREPAWLPTLADELQMPDEPVTYSIEGLLPRGGNVLLAAQFKSGKTTLINNLARSFADGEQFLGKFDVRSISGRVALFNYEVGRNQYRRWLADVGFERPDRAAVLNLRGYRLPLHVPHVETWVVEWLKRAEAEVWIVDPFARASVGSVLNENDNSEVGRWLDILDVIKDRAGVSELILPVHTGRAEFEIGKERARGATRLDDWPDVRWFLNKDDESGLRYFSATGRDVEFEESCLQFDETTRRLNLTEGNRKTKSKFDAEKVVLEVVGRSPGISKRQVREAVRERLGHSDNNAVDAALASLHRRGELRIEDMGNGRPTRHYLVDPITPFEFGGAS